MRGRRLWLVWAAVAVLAVVIWQGEVRRSAQIGAGTPTESKRLLPVPIGDVGGVEVMVKGTMHRFERDGGGIWFYHGMHDVAQAGHEHRADPRQAGTIATAMTAFGRMQREQRIPLKDGGDEYGVARPDIFIMVYRPGSDAPLARYAIGGLSPDGYSRYLLAVGASEIVTVPEFHIKNLLGLIDAMKTLRPST